jgi:[ribosomal protein S5]-alanine N-acetyltransferase
VNTPVFETPRLLLRPVTLRDAGAIQEHFANWNVIKHIGGKVPWPYPSDCAEIFLKEDALPRVAKGQADVWAICLKDARCTLIGVIEFRLAPDADDHRGFWLAEPYWRKGLMSEAVEAINGFVFEDLNVESFIEQNAADNSASRRLKEKSGGEFLHYCAGRYLSGESRSEVWRLTRAGWSAEREKKRIG